MSRELIDFPHRPGGHCGSTVLRDLLNFYGHDLTEEMVFGLGAGLGFIYYQHPEMMPPVYIGGRIFNLENLFCKHLGITMEEIKGLDDEEAWRRVKDRIGKGVPTVVQADVYYLDYLRAKRHFSAHRIVIVGYDEEKGVALVADNDRESIQECSLENLRKARSSAHLPQPAGNAYYRFQVPKILIPLMECLPQALSKVVTQNLRIPPNRRIVRWRGANVASGVWGIDDLARDMSQWGVKMDDETLALLFKSIYVTVEKGGTGYGGFFRRIYGRFLREAAPVLDFPSLSEIGDFYIDIGNGWTEIAELCRERSSEPREALPEVIERTAAITGKERKALELLESEVEILRTRSNGPV